MTTRRVILRALTVQASVGMLSHERRQRQPLILDAWFDTDASQPVQDDDIRSVLDYRLLREALIHELTQAHTDLLETLVQRCLQRILTDFPSVGHARIRLCKPQAFDDCAAVCIEQTAQRKHQTDGTQSSRNSLERPMSTEESPIGTLKRQPHGGHQGTLTRVFPGHDPAAVWAMLTQADKMAQWLAPGQIDLRAQGSVRIDFADSGIQIDSRVLELIPGQLLVYSWSSGPEPERPLRWALSRTSEGTQLELTVGVPAGEDAAKACAGFEGHLDMLAAALEGVPIKFPFERFLAARAAYNAQLKA